jgi:syntaxin 1B/2/3
LQHQESNYSQYSAAPPVLAGADATVPHTDVPMQQAYSAAPLEQHGARPLSREDYLSRIEGVKARIVQLTSDIQAIASVHQRMLSSPDNRSSSELESIVSQTQIRNTQIKDEIKFLEKDAAREPNNSFKRSQVEALKRSFKSQLEGFQREEADYSKRYREAIGRQYRIINPEATDAEVKEAANSDWGDEGIFTQAVSVPRAYMSKSLCAR